MITKAEIVAENKKFREENPERLWPHISPERIIRKARWFRGMTEECDSPEHYRLLLSSLAGEIVNDSHNW